MDSYAIKAPVRTYVFQIRSDDAWQQLLPFADDSDTDGIIDDNDDEHIIEEGGGGGGVIEVDEQPDGSLLIQSNGEGNEGTGLNSFKPL